MISISSSQFRRQMEWLKSGGWQTLSLNELLAGHARGDWPARSVVLTFDDGFKNIIDHALPVLSKCGFTATVFVVAGWVGRTNDWPGQANWTPRLPLLDWAGVRAAAEAGVQIGAHTISHPRLTHLAAATAEYEINGSKHIIEDRLGRAVETFAYPYGDLSDGLAKQVGENFRAGFSTRLAFATATSPVAALDRIDVYRLRDGRLFNALEAGWLDAYLHVRGWLATLRVKSLRTGSPVHSHSST